MKRIMLFCLLLTLAFSWTLPAHADLSQEEIYVALQEQLHDRLYGVENVLSFESLAQQFTQLGSYKKSAQYRYYTSILADTEAGYYGSLSRNFRLLRLDAAFCEQLAEEGLPTVDELEAYTQGRQAEAAGDWASAVACYERSIAVLDSLVRLDALLYEHANLVQAGVVVGEYTIDIYDNGTCEIREYRGNGGDLVIPRGIGGYQVRCLGCGLFNDNSRLTSVVIPEGVSSIIEWAFDNCTTLTSVTFPDSLVKLGAASFYGSRALKSIDIPVGVTRIEDWTFGHNVALTDATLPEGITFIGDNAFYACNQLRSINIPDTVVTIENYTFAECYVLTSLVLPDGLTYIGEGAFANCPNLTLRVQEGSHAQWYAEEYNIPYEIY